MKLHFFKTGEGFPVLILHGLFGLSDNWMTISKSFAAEGFAVYGIDLRNHGRSPHSDEMNYPLMAEDILEFMNDHDLAQCDLIGHSMGGKTAMFFAAAHPDRIRKLIVVDIAPRAYPPHHDSIIAVLESFRTEDLASRKEAEGFLRAGLQDEATIQFLLKNLYWNEQNKLAWRFNLNGIKNHISETGAALPNENSIQVPTLFIRGENSGYINPQDESDILKRFSNARIVTVAGAGHWVHAEKPAEFLRVAGEFLKN